MIDGVPVPSDSFDANNVMGIQNIEVLLGPQSTLGDRTAASGAILWTLYRLRLKQAAREFERGLEARVAERTRIARELHDTLLQSFQGLLLQFQTVWDLFSTRPAEAREILGNAIDQASDAITEGRKAVQGLRSSAEEPNDLEAAIGALGEELAADPAVTQAASLRVRAAGPARPCIPSSGMRSIGSPVRRCAMPFSIRRLRELRWICGTDEQ